MKSFLRAGLVALIAAASLGQVSGAKLHGDAERQRIIAEVNSNPSAGWRAGMNSRWAGQPIHAAQRQLGSLDVTDPNHVRLPVQVHTGFDMAALPDEFDSRVAWPYCKSIQEVRDQSDCGSCWSFGAVEAASDRICIATNGTNQAHLSAEDLLSCCTSCGFGCNGGYPSAAWSYLKNTGIVTGGNYGDKSWCWSYSMPNCDHHVVGKYEPCGQHDYNTPACKRKCDSDSTYQTPYDKDHYKFASAYSVATDPVQIQKEIMTYGPVEASFTVYADFMQYKGGVYRHITGSALGGHAIKLLGWGVDAATKLPYWLAANSWNEDWGEEGFFRILRGNNECGIERGIVAGRYLA